MQVFNPATNGITANTPLQQLVDTGPINLYPYVRPVWLSCTAACLAHASVPGALDRPTLQV